MRDPGVLGGQLLGGDEGDSGVVVGEVVGHLHDLPLDAGPVGTLLGHHVAVARVHGAGGQLDVVAGLDRSDGRLHRAGVLLGVHDAVDAAQGVGVPLGDAGPPERGGGAVGQDGLAQDPQHGEQARVPAGGDQGDVARGLGGGVDSGEVLGDAGVGVEGVDRVEQGGGGRGLLDQVSGRASAVQADIDLVGPGGHVVDVGDGRPLGGDAVRVTPGEDDGDLHVRVLGNGLLDTAAEVAVSVDRYPEHGSS